MSRRKKFDEEKELMYAIAAAYLRSLGHLQKVIGEKLEGVSQPEVSRLLQIAERRNWLGHPSFDPTGSADLWKKAEARFFSRKDVEKMLQGSNSKAKSTLRKVTLVHSKKDLDDNEDFLPPIVDVIKVLFSGVKMVGVTWGGTLSRLVSILGEHRADLVRSNDRIQFVPLCGEPLKDRIDPVSFSSSALAAKLTDIFNGTGNEPPPPSLAGVPIFIPLRFDTKTLVREAEVNTIRKFIRQVAGYAEVFGDGGASRVPRRKNGPLVDQVNVILTSVGIVPEDFSAEQRPSRLGTFLKERVQLGDLTEDELRQWIVGDIGGVIIERDGLDPSAVKRIKEMNRRWTGIQTEHLSRCARDAGEHKKPGVVVVATGKRRSGIVRRCVQLNLVSQLIIDEELEQQLRSDLQNKSAKP